MISGHITTLGDIEEALNDLKSGKLLLLLLNFITDSLLHTCTGKYDSCPNYKHYIKTLHY